MAAGPACTSMPSYSVSRLPLISPYSPCQHAVHLWPALERLQPAAAGLPQAARRPPAAWRALRLASSPTGHGRHPPSIPVRSRSLWHAAAAATALTTTLQVQRRRARRAGRSAAGWRRPRGGWAGSQKAQVVCGEGCSIVGPTRGDGRRRAAGVLTLKAEPRLWYAARRRVWARPLVLLPW